jgi:small subunit ribosomal protein S8
MSHTDLIADVLTRIRNALQAGHPSVLVPWTRTHESIVDVLKREGYILGAETAGEGPRKMIQVTLKYTADHRPVLLNVQRVSRPSRRVYVGHRDIPEVRSGLGISIISTPQGIMTDAAARDKKVGGEILCEVW